jgi:hypothetical protein
MNSQEFDDKFKNRVQNAESTPPAFVWNNVEKALRQPKRKPPFFWFLNGAAFLLISGLVLSAYLKTGETKQKDTISDKISQQELLLMSKDEVQFSVKEKANIITSVIGASSSEKTALSSTNNFVENEPFIDTKHDINKINPLINKKSVAKSESIFTGIILNSTTETNHFVTYNTEKTDENQTTLASSNQLTPKGTKDTNFDLLPLSNPNLGVFPRPYLNIEPIKPFWRRKNNRDCYHFSGRKSVWMLEGYVSPLLMQRALSSPSASEQGKINQRNATESKSFAMSAGLRAVAVVGQFTFKAGLNYNQFTEVFSYSNPNYIDIHIRRVFINGEWVETQSTEYGEKVVKSYNRFYLLDVPVTSGFELRKGRIGLGINAGISANIFFGKRGTILNNDQLPMPFTPSSPNNQKVFKSTVGLSVLGSAQAFYHYNAKTRFFVEPSYQGILKPVTLANYPIEQRYQIWGLKLGIAKILD